MNQPSLTIGFSPCPNDTFAFYALVHGKIPLRGMSFAQQFGDIESLNMMAMRSELDVTKLSYHALGHVRSEYFLLRSGGALGRGCGPLVVAREACDVAALAGRRIAVPGRYTTAFLLLLLCNPSLGDDAVFMPFDRIMHAVSRGEADAGVIIHESRFTYGAYGLKAIMDLGQWWEAETALPLPLGAVAVRRSLGAETARKVETLIRESVQYALRHPGEPLPYVRTHAQEMDVRVMGKHIELYVNPSSVGLDEEGEAAVRRLLAMAETRGILRESSTPLFPWD